MSWWNRNQEDKQQTTNKRQSEITDTFDLDYPLIQLSPYPEDVYYLRDALEGIQIFGGTGSGKTSGSGQVLAKTFLSAGYGGLVLCGKVEEVDIWKEYAQAIGREDQLVIFDTKAHWQFNFLDYEYNRSPEKESLKSNLVYLFRLMGELQNPSRQGAEPFWRNEADKLLSHAIEVLTTAKENINLFDIHQLVMSAPLSLADTANKKWQEDSFLSQCLQEGTSKTDGSRDFLLAGEYWLKEFPAMPDKTRANIVSSFTGSARHFMQGTMGKLFCGETNIRPEDTEEGAIIVLDLPPDEYQQTGILAQMMFKFFWQAAAKRRKVTSNTRPIFLWGDESQFFLNRYDGNFLRTARSSRATTVFLTQDISGYYDALRSKETANTLLANFQTKIFHANTDPETNRYAAEHCAKSFQKRTGTSHSTSQKQTNPFTWPKADNDPTTNVGSSTNEHLEYNIQPEEFLHLRRGGPENDSTVDGVLIKAGRYWQVSEG